MSGTLNLRGTPPLVMPTGAAIGSVLTTDGSGNVSPQPAPIFSPMNYAAAGNGTTDDTTPVLAAFAAAAVHNGTVDLGYYRFLTSSPIPVYSGLHVRGAAWNGGQRGVGGGTIINNTTDMF